MAYHCTFKLGFRSPSTRVVIHGLLGPNPDGLRPTYAQVRTKVQHGGGGGPSFADRLSAKEIRDVAAFVATSAGR